MIWLFFISLKVNDLMKSFNLKTVFNYSTFCLLDLVSDREIYKQFKEKTFEKIQTLFCTNNNKLIFAFISVKISKYLSVIFQVFLGSSNLLSHTYLTLNQTWMEAKTGNLYDFLVNYISILIKAKVTLLYFICSIKLCYVF